MDRLEPIPPGEILAEEFMKPLGVSQNRLARDIDIPVSRVSDIVRGGRAITADTALRLAEYFGTTAEMWMRLQSDYDLRVARAGKWDSIRPRIRAFDSA
jgi:addiction module HigA family antidote